MNKPQHRAAQVPAVTAFKCLAEVRQWAADNAYPCRNECSNRLLVELFGRVLVYWVEAGQVLLRKRRAT